MPTLAERALPARANPMVVAASSAATADITPPSVLMRHPDRGTGASVQLQAPLRYFFDQISPNPSTRAFVQHKPACFAHALTKMRLSCCCATHTAAQALQASPIHCTSLTLFQISRPVCPLLNVPVYLCPSVQ